MGLKARVKATGDIFEVSDTTTIYPEHYDKSYNITEVEFLDECGDLSILTSSCVNLAHALVEKYKKEE